MIRYNSRIVTIGIMMILQCQYSLYSTIICILSTVTCTAMTTTNNNNNTIRYTRNNTINNTERVLKRKKKYYNTISKRIIGGSIVSTSTKYPWFTVSAGSELCGSTLIHPDILLTAAHCSGAFITNGVMVGGTLLNGTDPTMQYSTVLNEYYHSQYNESMNLINDIMLVKLSQPISSTSTTDNTNIIQYNTINNIPKRLEVATILGYGLTTETNSTASSVLLDTTINIVPYEYCTNLFQYLDNERMICAGVSDGSNDACQGDSGGPLIIQNESSNNTANQQQESSYTQIGITSFGIGCGRPNMPAVYTRVSYYHNWIVDGICSISSVPLSDPTICSNVKGSFIYNTTTQNTTTTTTETPTTIPSTSPTTTIPTTTIQVSSSKPTITPTSQTQNTLLPTMSPTKLQQQPSVSTMPSSSMTAPTTVLATKPILQNVTSFNPTKIPSSTSLSPSPSSTTATVQPSSTKVPATTTQNSKRPSVVPINTTNSPSTIIKSKTPVKSSNTPPIHPSISVSSNIPIPTSPTTIKQQINKPTISPSTSLGDTVLTTQPSLDLTYRPVSQGKSIPFLNNNNNMRNRNQRWKIKCIFLSIARKKNATNSSIVDTTSATTSINDKDGEKQYNGVQVPQTASSIKEIMEKNRNIKTEMRMMMMKRRFQRKNMYDKGNDFNTTTMELLMKDLKKIEKDKTKKINETYSSTETIEKLPKSVNQTTDSSFNTVDLPFGHATITSDEEAAYQNKTTPKHAENLNKTISSPPISIFTDRNVFLKRVSSQRVP